MSSYWQGKGAGKRIGIRFDKPLVGDVAGLSAPAFYDMIIPPGTPTASGQYSATYTPDKAFDGSTSTRWYIRTTGDQWIQIELPEPRFTNGFRWYTGSSYRPNGFTVQGSNDGESWTNIYSDNSANTTGWKEFNWTATGPYKFYRWTVTSRHSSYIYIYEIELSLGMGNANAFTVKGMVRNPLKYGPLTERTFTVESVERYPLTVFWEDDFTGAMDGVEVGVNGVVLEGESGEVEGTENAIPLMTSNTAPSGTASASSQDSASYQAYHCMDRNTGTYWSTTSGGRYPSWLQYEFAEPQKIYKYAFTPRGGGAFNGIPRDWVLQGWNGSSWDDLHTVTGETWSDSNRREFLVDSVGEYSRYRIYITMNNGRDWTQISVLEMFGMEEGLSGFNDAGTYTTTTPAGALPANPRLKWTEDLPTGTSITAEYAVNQDDETPPETWIAINNADLLTIPDPATGYFLWLCYTLETEDTSKTPTLLSAWLEEPTAPPGTILLTMAPDSRFNDVEGDLIISYEREKGTLTGNRPVEDFTESFTPTGLEPTPLNVQGTITAGIEVEVDLIEVDYIDLGHKHTITAGITVEVDLIPVLEIPP